jgi:hypothetical protein
MPDSMHLFFGCEGSGDIRQRNETRGKRIVAISPKLANMLNCSLLNRWYRFAEKQTVFPENSHVAGTWGRATKSLDALHPLSGPV